MTSKIASVTNETGSRENEFNTIIQQAKSNIQTPLTQPIEQDIKIPKLIAIRGIPTRVIKSKELIARKWTKQEKEQESKET